MVSERDAVRQYVSRVTGGRPVRWTDERTSRGAFAGWQWALEVFNVPWNEQRGLLDRLWELRERVKTQLRVTLTFIFHTPENTARFYSWVRSEEPLQLIDSARPQVARLRVPQLLGRRGRLDRDIPSSDLDGQRAA